jgi:hypothetical protein
MKKRVSRSANWFSFFGEPHVCLGSAQHALPMTKTPPPFGRIITPGEMKMSDIGPSGTGIVPRTIRCYEAANSSDFFAAISAGFLATSGAPSWLPRESRSGSQTLDVAIEKLPGSPLRIAASRSASTDQLSRSVAVYTAGVSGTDAGELAASGGALGYRRSHWQGKHIRTVPGPNLVKETIRSRELSIQGTGGRIETLPNSNSQ